MTYEHPNNYPKLHNAAWATMVGKGPGAEPPIDLDTMLDLTADAKFEGIRFDGVDLLLFAPHVDIDSRDDAGFRQLADDLGEHLDGHDRGAGQARLRGLRNYFAGRYFSTAARSLTGSSKRVGSSQSA